MRKPAADSAGVSLPDALASFSPNLPLAVAFSGGADSTALLLACVERWPGQVLAVHVHHGLQAAADDFVRHCQTLCATRQVPLMVCHVDARHAAGESPEDAARTARYAALRSALQDPLVPLACHDIALAQHADDQIETLLLALSRGAGLPGLSAMPARWERDGITFHRPLLQLPGSALRAWLAQRGVSHVEDPTNTDERITRNRIRARLIPALDATFPRFRTTFARSARHAAQAQQLLRELAQQDLTLVARPADGALLIARLQGLSRARQTNLLRHWFKSTHAASANTAQMEELLRQIANCTTRGHRIHIKVADGFAHRRGEVLAWYNAEPDSG